MAAAKDHEIFVCGECGLESRKWLGRCTGCGAWNSMAAHRPPPQGKSGRGGRGYDPPALLNEAGREVCTRIVTGIGELDRVLGGGIVPGSVILIGGDPGIGKSTLLLQLMSAISADGGQVLYVTGEESAQQVRMRAERLGLAEARIMLATETSVEAVVAMAAEMRPVLLAVDSIQTISSEEIPSSPGTVTQVRESAARLLHLAKTSNLPVILVGHVTKDGNIAGPRILEHMVDTVLYFEGDRGQVFRILRAVKNRFGSTNEIGVFEMKEAGLAEVANPSELFLAERNTEASGSVVLPSIEGTRPILVEVQALVSPCGPGTPRRTAIGSDSQRLTLLAAVLEKKAGHSLAQYDIFLNIAGGLRVEEPALDLGVAVALVSSLYDRPVDPGTVVCGEIGLAGEIRGVGQMEQRLREAQRLGFTRLLLPASNLRRLEKADRKRLHCLGAASLSEAMTQLFGPRQG